MRHLIAALFVLSPLPLQAQEATTNFPALTGYPDPACPAARTLPARPTNTRDLEAVDRYNGMIQAYNREAKAHADCINAYIRNANHDMELIRDKTRAAANAANAR